MYILVYLVVQGSAVVFVETNSGRQKPQMYFLVMGRVEGAVIGEVGSCAQFVYETRNQIVINTVVL